MASANMALLLVGVGLTVWHLGFGLQGLRLIVRSMGFGGQRFGSCCFRAFCLQQKVQASALRVWRFEGLAFGTVPTSAHRYLPNGEGGNGSVYSSPYHPPW